MQQKYIGYCRVSTKQQGSSGLGLQSQQKSVLGFIQARDGELIEPMYVEVESGSKNERPELQKAIAKSIKLDATLVIAKIDRLSRNLTFISSLMDTKVKFKAVDMPEADNFTIHIFASLAQKEREQISDRTKKALAEKKALGFKLGTPENLTNEARQKGVTTIKENAQNNKANRQATEMIAMYRKQGLSFQKIANKLTDLGYKTRRGKDFGKSSVKMLFDRSSKF